MLREIVLNRRWAVGKGSISDEGLHPLLRPYLLMSGDHVFIYLLLILWQINIEGRTDACCGLKSNPSTKSLSERLSNA